MVEDFMKNRHWLSLMMIAGFILGGSVEAETKSKNSGATSTRGKAGLTPKIAKLPEGSLSDGLISGEKKVGAARLRLLTDTDKVLGGKPFRVGVYISLEPHWYIYWQFVGAIGLPTRVDWDLPKGFTAGPLQWPIPTVHGGGGDFLNYVYEGEVLLFAEITPPADLPADGGKIKAKVKWQMCNAAQCVPEEAALELALPTGGVRVADLESFVKWEKAIPRADPPPFRVLWDRTKAGEFSLRVEGLGVESPVEFFPLPPVGVELEEPKTTAVTPDGGRTITFPMTKGGQVNLPWRGVLVVGKGGGEREGWTIEAEGGEVAPVAASGGVVEGGKEKKGISWGGLLAKIMLAVLGGLIMNVMPCVLPVLALKIYGFVQQAEENPARIFRLGLAFTGGVFGFFLGLAVAVANLKSAFNWGYQFQNPYLLAGMIALIFVFSLNLLGVFEVTLGGEATSKLSSLAGREGYGGAFLHGFFTTLLGTSCTAPFLATSLSFATTQSTPVIFALFSAIAAGMSLPYLLLTAKPGWLRWVPKPGAWMERVKQGMGFVMLAVAVWLFTVLGLRGAEAVGGMSWFLLALALTCWLFGTMRGGGVARWALVMIPLAAWFFFLNGKLSVPHLAEPEAGKVWKTGEIEWLGYTEERLAEARLAGRPVFVDFTAEWCINCKAYERLVLGTAPVGAAFKAKKILPLRADWTNTEDPVVTRALKSFGRVGVPLYVLYRPGETEPVILDAITVQLVLAELEKIKN